MTLRVLLSAYACEPGKGSEPEVGVQALLAAARRHEVWALTRANNVPSLDRFLDGHPHRERIHVVGLDLGQRELRRKRRFGLAGLHWYYDRWQRAAATKAAELDRQVGFDLVHHVTFAAYWTRAGVAELDRPFVWGPVGGGVEVPPGLIPELGWRGLGEEGARFLTRRAMAAGPAPRHATRNARVVLVQNPETARRIDAPGIFRMAPNGAAASIDALPEADGRRNEIVMVGRLVPWKGGVLGVRAFRHLPPSDLRLAIIGRGPELDRIRRRIHAWGLGDRVEIVGPLPRVETLARIRSARAMLHPSFHDEASLAVAEALALGTPLVALRKGATPEMALLWPDTPSVLVKPTTPERTAQALAKGLESVLSRTVPVPSEPRPARKGWPEEILEAYEVALGSS